MRRDRDTLGSLTWQRKGARRSRAQALLTADRQARSRRDGQEGGTHSLELGDVRLLGVLLARALDVLPSSPLGCKDAEQSVDWSRVGEAMERMGKLVSIDPVGERGLEPSLAFRMDGGWGRKGGGESKQALRTFANEVARKKK